MSTGQQVLLHGHRPETFTGQKRAVLDLLLKHRGAWVHSYRLAELALQYSARVKELRDAGYTIDNRTERVNGKVHGAFRLVSCPGEPSTTAGGAL